MNHIEERSAFREPDFLEICEVKRCKSGRFWLLRRFMFGLIAVLVKLRSCRRTFSSLLLLELFEAVLEPQLHGLLQRFRYEASISVDFFVCEAQFCDGELGQVSLRGMPNNLFLFLVELLPPFLRFCHDGYRLSRSSALQLAPSARVTDVIIVVLGVEALDL